MICIIPLIEFLWKIETIRRGAFVILRESTAHRFQLLSSHETRDQHIYRCSRQKIITTKLLPLIYSTIYIIKNRKLQIPLLVLLRSQIFLTKADCGNAARTQAKAMFIFIAFLLYILKNIHAT